MRAVALAAVLMLVPAPAHGHMTPAVVHARVWLRSKMSRHHFACLHRLWANESGWRVHARGPRTRWGRAYGIPQALPGAKMARAGKDWRTNAMTQVRWGLHYIRGRYGGPCRALAHQRRWGWY